MFMRIGFPFWSFSLGSKAGLPEIPRTFAVALATALAAGLASAGAVSVIQAVTVPFLLPRFVVLVTPLLLVPVHIACWRMAQVGDERRVARHQRPGI